MDCGISVTRRTKYPFLQYVVICSFLELEFTVLSAYKRHFRSHAQRPIPFTVICIMCFFELQKRVEIVVKWNLDRVIEDRICFMECGNQVLICGIFPCICTLAITSESIKEHVLSVVPKGGILWNTIWMHSQ